MRHVLRKSERERVGNMIGPGKTLISENGCLSEQRREVSK